MKILKLALLVSVMGVGYSIHAGLVQGGMTKAAQDQQKKIDEGRIAQAKIVAARQQASLEAAAADEKIERFMNKNSFEEFMDAQDRLTAAQQELNNLEKYINIVKAKTDDEVAGYQMAELLLKSKNPPTAIACFNDLHAIGAQASIINLKAKVALVGYDNTYLSGLSQISLTSIDPGNKEIANKCSDLLLTDEIATNFTYESTPSLVVRNSSIKAIK